MTNQFKPTLRNEAKLDLNGALSYVIWKQFQRIDLFPFRNCLNCLNFNKEKELCNLCNQRPPAEIIAYGCPKHDDVAEIPF